MKRRTLVQCLPLVLAGCTRAGSGSADVFPSRPYTDFNAWLKDARAATLPLIEKGGARDPARFVQLLALWAVAMPRFVVREWQAVKGANAKLESALIASGRPFSVSAFRMAPGCLQPVHCHPGAGGITVVHEGSLGIKHFDLVPGSTEFTNTGGAAEISESSIAAVYSGRFTTFTPSAGNLHQLEAGTDGAVGVDILVQWSGSGNFSYLKLKEAISTAEGLIGARHVGAWTGMDIAKAYR
jgi:2-aminoethanethiol dioxygenase/cysteine oxidase family protein